MIASIIIASYNHGRFLREAIDSALTHAHPDTEVVVVDDESTDESPRIIESYGRSVVTVFKRNGGHTSAINAGFAACRGDVICPLDSDDVFMPDKIPRVLDAWHHQPEACLVYHQLVTITSAGTRRGRPWPQATWSGDIRARIQTTGGWWPRPTTSGLCFSRAFLERVLPMPEGDRIWPDTYLAPVAALLAPVVGLDVPLGCYRVHDTNTIAKVFPASRVRSERQAVGKRVVEQHLMELKLLRECLHRLMKCPPTLSLDAHPAFQRARRTAGEDVSLWRIASTITKCPSVPPMMKPKALFKAIWD